MNALLKKRDEEVQALRAAATEAKSAAESQLLTHARELDLAKADHGTALGKHAEEVGSLGTRVQELTVETEAAAAAKAQYEAQIAALEESHAQTASSGREEVARVTAALKARGEEVQALQAAAASADAARAGEEQVNALLKKRDEEVQALRAAAEDAALEDENVQVDLAALRAELEETKQNTERERNAALAVVQSENEGLRVELEQLRAQLAATREDHERYKATEASPSLQPTKSTDEERAIKRERMAALLAKQEQKAQKAQTEQVRIHSLPMLVLVHSGVSGA